MFGDSLTFFSEIMNLQPMTMKIQKENEENMTSTKNKIA